MEREKIEEILINIGRVDVPADVRKIAEDASTDFSETLSQSSQPGHFILGDYFMKSKFTKLAVAAAVIILVVLVGLPFVGKKNRGVALADVLAKVEQAKAFMYKMKMTMTGNMISKIPSAKQEMEGSITISNEYGMKFEMEITDPNTGKKMTQQMYILPAQKAAFMIMPEKKKFVKMEFSDDLLARMKKQNNDPREMIKQIMGCQYTELGRSIIDGKEVVGFHTTDPAMLGGATADVNYTLWVDTKSWLPVRADMEIKINEQMEMQCVIYDFQWDIPANISDFEPVIPKDFTAFPAEGLKMPEMTEQAAIEGFKFFADILGKYPNSLNMISVMKEFSEIKNNQNLTEAGLKLKEEMKSLDKEKNIDKAMNIMRPAQSLAMFYMSLVQDKKEPVYYGESVGPNNGDKILLRWKVSEGKYRVIYGNLMATDVTPEKLAELENHQPK